MTAIPGGNTQGGNNQNPLNNNTAALNRHGIVLGSNVRSVIGLTASLTKFADLASNLTESFKKADNLQVKSLAVGSSLKKVLEGNNVALSKMQGSFFENAEELLLNYSEGIRENSDDLNALNNRMRLTGQSTDLLRKVAGSLSVVTGGNLDAVSRLTKSNIDLSKQYGVTSESLLEAIQSINNLVDQASFVDASEQVADLAMSVRALAGDKAGDQTTKLLNFFLDPKFLQTRIALGMGTIDDQLIDTRLSTESRLDLLVKASKIAEDKLEELNNVNGMQNKIFKSELALSRFGDTSTLRAVINSSKTMQQQLLIQNKFKDDQAKVTDSILAQEELARSYYEMATMHVYPAILRYLPLIAGATVGGSLAMTSARLMKDSPKLATFAGLFGPIGLAAGAVLTFLPEITSVVTKFATNSEQQTRIQKEIAENTKKKPEKPDKREISTLSDFILRSMTEVGRMPLTQKSNPQLDEIRNILDEIRKATEKSRGLLPSNTSKSEGR
jgi:hypothetical protein